MQSTPKHTCLNCRFWSQMVAQSIGCGPVEALCLGDGKYKSKYTTGKMWCDSWKSDHHGKVDDPPNYGEISRAAYEAEDAIDP